MSAIQPASSSRRPSRLNITRLETRFEKPWTNSTSPSSMKPSIRSSITPRIIGSYSRSRRGLNDWNAIDRLAVCSGGSQENTLASQPTCASAFSGVALEKISGCRVAYMISSCRETRYSSRSGTL